MKIIILGVNGLIGNGLYNFLSNKSNLDLYVSYRNENKFKSYYKFAKKNKSFFFAYENKINELSNHITSINPDFIINCVGITKHLSELYTEKQIYNVNSEFPYALKDLCDVNNAKLIHVSTDCVFNGKKGNYNERNKPNALDIYGKSKALGEINDEKHLTIRTSTIGFEKNSKYGLLEWFLNQKKECYGFTNAYFSGLTVLELAKILYDYIFFNNNLFGLYNISSYKISKHDLLIKFSTYFNKNIKIIPEDSFVIDRTLDNTKFTNKTNYKTKTWDYMLKQISSQINE